ncbi:esterase/lipase family protein [Asticcacaulis sp.]|uniref:esterase/lipase family protein n=1 Tax=Asticcacaulis sp. TaxID=1872648 RepID=UPI003F7B6747
MGDGENQVVLFHGLAETPTIMASLEMVLRLEGAGVDNVAYPSTLFAADVLVQQYILPIFDRHKDATHLHFVTHSLGGVLLHAALQQYRPRNLGRVVMTAPGLHGSEVLEVYRRNWWFRMIYGPAAFQSGTGSDGFAGQLRAHADYELGIIAGAVSLDPMANLLAPWPHDGKISVNRTKLAGMRDHIVLPLPHDLLSSDPMAVGQVQHFLKYGHFLHLLQPQEMTEAA